MKDKIPVCGYIRVSTVGQKDGESLPDQREQIRKYCSAMNYDFVKLYEDGGVSGSSIERPALNELIRDARAGKFQKIVFKKMSRFGRNAKDLLNLFDEFQEKMKIDLVSIEENFDTSTPVGRLIRTVLCAIVEFDKDTITSQLQMGKERRLAKGQYAGGAIPYGYKWISPEKKGMDGKIVIDEDQRDVLYLIRNYILFDNLSMHDIATMLNADGIKSPQGKTWSSMSFSSVLKNDALFGNYVCKKTQWKIIDGKNTRLVDRPMTDHHIIKIEPAIFTKAEVVQIRDAIKSRERRGVKQVYNDRLLLKGILECGLCKTTVSPISGWKSKKTGKTIMYYGCYWAATSEKNRKEAKKEKCKLPYVDADKLDKYVWDFVIDQLVFTDEKVLNKFLDVGSYATKRESLEREIKALKKKSSPLEKKKGKYLELYADGVLNKSDLYVKIAELENQMESIKDSIEAKEDELKKISSSIVTIKKYKKQWMDLANRQVEAREKLDALSFDDKKWLVRYLLQDVNIELHPTTKEEANRKTPPDENYEWYGYFFGQGKEIGVRCMLEGYLDPHKVINLLESLEKNYILNLNNISHHSSQHVFRRGYRNNQNSQRDGAFRGQSGPCHSQTIPIPSSHHFRCWINRRGNDSKAWRSKSFP